MTKLWTYAVLNQRPTLLAFCDGYFWCARLFTWKRLRGILSDIKRERVPVRSSDG